MNRHTRMISFLKCEPYLQSVIPIDTETLPAIATNGLACLYAVRLESFDEPSDWLDLKG